MRYLGRLLGAHHLIDCVHASNTGYMYSRLPLLYSRPGWTAHSTLPAGVHARGPTVIRLFRLFRPLTAPVAYT